MKAEGNKLNMGARASKQPSAEAFEPTKRTRQPTKIVCENCNPNTQKDLPANDESSEQCMDSYLAVDLCMKANRGQVTSCVDEWKEFQACHASQKEQQQTAAELMSLVPERDERLTAE